MRIRVRQSRLRLLIVGILVVLVIRLAMNLTWPLHFNPVPVNHTDGQLRLRGQYLIDYIAKRLVVRFYKEETGENVLSLKNTGALAIPLDKSWTIYFNHAAGFVDVAHQKSLLFEDVGLIMRHIDGWFFSLEPIVGVVENDSLKLLRPRETLTFRRNINIKSKSYLFPNWYVSGDGLKPVIIQSTSVDKMDVEGISIETWPSAKRYARYETRDLKMAPKAIIPTPLEMKNNSGEIKLDEEWKIVYQPGLKEEVAFLAEKLIPSCTYCELMSDDMEVSKTISLAVRNISAIFSKFHKGIHVDEGYVIKIASNQISVHGQTSRGVFYGVQSLVSLLDGSKDGLTLPVSEIIDAPRLEFRGLMLDVARNFIEKSEIIRTLDVMAMYKLNKLHLHLTDDQGWRIEIPTLPELTKIGSRRGHDLSQKNSLLPYFGFGPKSKQQYYSVHEYQEILRHANRRHIEVIPEVDMPGHSHAAVQSMRMRYKRLRKNGSDEAIASKFRVHDPKDASWYLSENEHKDSVLNPCLESTYTFVREVLQSIIDTHKVVQPLKTFHFGGDEVPKGALVLSPICNALIKASPHLNGSLKMYFMKRVINITNQLNVMAQMWDDGLLKENGFPVDAKDWGSHIGVTVNTWYSPNPAAYRFANKEYKVVLSQANRLYLDHPNEPDTEETGLFWATRFIDAPHIFTFMYSRNLGKSDFAQRETCRVIGLQPCEQLKHPENIIGMQASLWTEMIRKTADLHYMLYPRLLAFAERAWHMAAWETEATEQRMAKLLDVDWTDFANTVGYKELRRLERIGINYRLSTPGVRVEKWKVKANTAFPGSLIQYSVDGGKTWNNYTLDAELNESEQEDLKFSVVSHNLRRRGRVISFQRRRKWD